MFLQHEIWEGIPEYFGYYEISNKGRVRSLDRYIQHGNCIIHRSGKILKPIEDQNGYLHVYLAKNGKQLYKSIHVLVASVFLNAHSPDLEVNHKDGDKSNNSVDNLEWVSHKQNILHAFDKGLHPKYSREYMLELSRKGNKASIAKSSIPILCETDGLAFVSQNAADRYYGFYPGSISSCLKKQTPIFHGRRFRKLLLEELNNYTLLS